MVYLTIFSSNKNEGFILFPLYKVRLNKDFWISKTHQLIQNQHISIIRRIPKSNSDICFSRPTIPRHHILIEDESISSELFKIISDFSPERTIHSSIRHNNLWPTQICSWGIRKCDIHLDRFCYRINKRNSSWFSGSMLDTDNFLFHSIEDRIICITTPWKIFNERWLNFSATKIDSTRIVWSWSQIWEVTRWEYENTDKDAKSINHNVELKKSTV